MHYAKLMIYQQGKRSKLIRRWWMTSCGRKSLSSDKWSTPADVTYSLLEVSCDECLKKHGMELLQYLG
jgi:hypothetical protein